MFTAEFLIYVMVGILATMVLPALASPKAFSKAIRNVVAETENVRMLSFPMMLLGVMFLSVEWRIEQDWSALIAILGWLTVLKGLVFLWFPEYAQKKTDFFYKSESSVSAWGFFALIMAVALIYININYIA